MLGLFTFSFLMLTQVNYRAMQNVPGVQAAMSGVHPLWVLPARAAPNPLALNPQKKYSNLKLRQQQQQSFAEQLTSYIDPNILKRYEGSHTWSELQQGSDDPLSVNLRSAWLTGSSNTPQAGLTVQKNPDSGNLEVSGAEIFFPDKGFGFSREEDRKNNESKTFFNMKKEF